MKKINYDFFSGPEEKHPQYVSFFAGDLTNQVYLLRLKPREPFWKFSVLLFDLHFPHDQHNENLGKNAGQEIVFQAGHSSKGKWTRPDQLSFWVNNGRIPHTRRHEYSTLEEVNIYLQYLPYARKLAVNYILPNGRTYNAEIEILPEIKLHLTASAEKSIIDLSCEITTYDLDEVDLPRSPFKVSNILFRQGSMFNYEAISAANMLLLPSSLIGQVSNSNSEWASANKIPPPSRHSLGEIEVFELETYKGKYYAGYAFSVSAGKSSLEIIDKLVGQILAFTRSNRQIMGINIPLLGTGSGQLNPFEVAKTLIEGFYMAGFAIEVIVSIEGDILFDSIRREYEGRASFLPGKIERNIPEAIKSIEAQYGEMLNGDFYHTNLDGEVTQLTITQSAIRLENPITQLKELHTLTLDSCMIDNLEFTAKLPRLRKLSIANSNLLSDEGIRDLQGLESIDLSYSSFRSFEDLNFLFGLRTLRLRGLGLYSLTLQRKLPNLRVLDLSNNELSEVSFISAYKRLISLNISANRIKDISFLKELPELFMLNASENRILDASAVLKAKKLEQLIIDKNPLEQEYEVNLSESENHLTTIKNYLLRQAEKSKVAIRLPLKIMLLGNHASGKSSLLEYICNGTLKSTMPSTHVINIVPYQTSGVLPKAIFFDFGGQDYYHGIYRAFLSAGAAYLLLWQESTNKNQIREDSHKLLTQDFKLDYWLAQKNYLEQEKFNTNDPLILIQSHAEKDVKSFCEVAKDFGSIKNEFFVSLKKDNRYPASQHYTSLKNFHALQYLTASIDELIEENKVIKKEPEWYINFLVFILSSNETVDHLGKDLIQDILPMYKREEEPLLEFLKDDLEQLHKQGLIIYYKDELPDRVWLSPVNLTRYIHEKVLSSAAFQKSKGRIPKTRMDRFSADVIELLVLQKVLFYHHAEEEYIVPNFLPLASTDAVAFKLMTFGLGEPLFVLKFKHFLPFGLINQIICSFGILPRQKLFWRDQILFTLEDSVKVLIKVDFQLLEIKVYAYFPETKMTLDKKAVSKYLFYGLLAIYWDFEVLSFGEFQSFEQKQLKSENYQTIDPLYKALNQAENLYINSNCQPLDLFISLDDKYFINYTDLYNTENEVQIQVEKVNKQRELTNHKKNVPIFQFQPFTLKELKKPKKAVISYSKKDLKFVRKFKQYLVPLANDGLIQEPWFCTDLVAGNPWDETIQQKFEEADIIFFMISENLMSNKYVKENEIKMVIDRWNKSQNIMIVPIILVHYRYGDATPYDLSKFTALPFIEMPISSFKDKHRAWDYVSEGIRIMIEQKLYPGTPEIEVNEKMKAFQDDMIRKRDKGKNF